MRRVAPPNDVNAPSPTPAHHLRPSAGALTTPTTGTPSVSSAISVAQTGTPRTKFFVPSIGIDHPLATGESRCAPELFAENRVVGTMRRQRRAQQLLGRPVGIGDRGEVGLGVDAQIERAESVQCQRVGRVGHFQGER